MAGAFNFTVQDTEGNVIAGASVTVYRESDGGVASIYSDVSLTTPKGNPFATDANGYGIFYAANGQYKVVATYMSNTMTWRHIQIGDDSGGGAGDLLSTNNLSDLADAGAARTNLGLGTMATATESNYYTTTEADSLIGARIPYGAVTYAPASLVGSDAQYYFSDYDCKAQIAWRFDNNENQSAIAGGGIRDILFLDHRVSDYTDYTAIGQKIAYGIRSYVTAVSTSTAIYQDLVGGTFEAIGRVEWSERGTSGLTASAFQYGTGIASNELFAGNPAAATNQSLSMASVQAIISSKKGASDGTRKARAVLATNLGKTVTSAFEAMSLGTDGDSGYYANGLNFTSATIASGGAAIVMPQSETSHEGTTIVYDTNDYTGYIRSGTGANTYFWTIAGNIVAALSANNVVFSASRFEPINTTLATAVVSPRVQSIGADNPSSSFLGARFSADSGGPVMYFGKSRHATLNSHTIVDSGDNLGSISWAGSDGTDFAEAARIMAQVDGTPGAGDMPGRITFLTSADGSESPTEHMRLDSSGNLGLGVTAGPFAGVTSGRRFLSIKGTTGRGVLQLSTSEADGDNIGVGNLEWHDEAIATTANRRSAYIAVTKRGATANNRGSGMAFATKANNSTTLSETLLLDEKGNVILGNLTAAAQMATSATDGFTYSRSMAGVPTGTPTTFTGTSPIALDTANGRLWMYDGSAWRSHREQLTANRTYYVRNDGSDSNNGKANTAGGAFATIQKAFDVVAGIDIGAYTVTIQCATGSFAAGTVTGPWIGGGTVLLKGDTTTPANCTITDTTCITVQGGGRLSIEGFKLVGSAACLFAQGASTITVTGNMEYGAGASAFHLYALSAAFININAGYTISGSATGHLLGSQNGSIYQSGGTVTLTGTPAFSLAFAYCNAGATVTSIGVTYSGSATGPRYGADTNGTIYTAGGANYFPGNSAGSTTNDGVYA